jgi:hypothetical protein
MDALEREHVTDVKRVACACCDAPGPTEAHEIVQGLWFLSVSACRECHRGAHGIHGDKVYMTIRKLTELDMLNITLRRVALLRKTLA